MQDLLLSAERAGSLLRERQQTIVVAESASGGLISAALLAVPGASAYFVGGAVLYTRAAHTLLIELTEEAVAGLRPATESHTLAVARHARKKFGTTWCLAEHGAAGPTGNRYGDPPGHSALALAGPAERTRLIRTGRPDRAANMQAFARGALELLIETLAK